MQTILILLLTTTFSTENLDLQLGKKIYQKRCKVCHGIQGKTNPYASKVLDPPPRNFTSKQSKTELTEKRMIFSATNGRPGTAMMPWKNILSPSEIRAVVNYIRRHLMRL